MILPGRAADHPRCYVFQWEAAMGVAALSKVTTPA